MRYILSDCKTILDLGCGDNSPIRFLQTKTYGIDASREAISIAKKKKTHDILKVMDVKRACDYCKSKSFDAVVALDVIEHLRKDAGEKLIKDMEKIAKKRVIIFTPNGFVPQKGKTIYDSHLSGWTDMELRNKGYKVFGIYGPKRLRGDYHKIKFEPEFFWTIISELIQWTYIYNNPQNAAALLCIKDIKK